MAYKRVKHTVKLLLVAKIERLSIRTKQTISELLKAKLMDGFRQKVVRCEAVPH
jgi:hypothetical protein